MTTTMPDETTASDNARNDRIDRLLQSNLVRWLVLLAIGVIAILGGMLRGLPMAILVLASGTLLLIIWLLWNSLQGLTGESPMSLEEALGLGAPTAEEEQKRAVLRALKDLEYEHSVGKISEEDYAALTAKYRTEAKALLRLLDQSLAPNRAHAEKLLEKRLAGEDLGDKPRRRARKKDKNARVSAPPEAEHEDESTPEAEATSAPEHEEPAAKASPEAEPPQEAPASEPPAKPKATTTARGPTRRCSGCSTRNDLDARFCKGCGATMVEEGQALCTACPAAFDSSLDACPECGVPQEDA